MKKDDHYLLGSLLKTTGIKGEIVLKFNNDCPEEIQKLESILVDVDQKLVPFFIDDIKIKSNSTAIVKIEGLDNEQQSNEFINSDFYIGYDQVQLLQITPEEYIDVVGYMVKDQNNKDIGEVIEFIDIPENPVLNVKSAKGEILIPAKDELIIEVDDDLKVVQLHITDGLLDLNDL
jgi:16S rRNA processing protein RimM